ncbi:MAG: T9SS type A sorting domain-containing protein [Bacteroidales bacterium]|nr:T9SS type A sorting domain-containing protein [Bacteroidales bacterium]
MKIILHSLICFLFLFVGTKQLTASPLDLLAQDDTVMVAEILYPPAYDGVGDDDCWQGKTWQSIDQVWIPWGTTMNSGDFSGRYKVVWSRVENLLYFLLEITDDVESDAYVPDGSTADIYNFDMFEVFIDEDKSGGPHVYQTPENAFAYHTFTKFPESGQTTSTFICDDMGSDYRSHFPDFVLRKDGNVATWEFSLIVYNDTYTPSNPEDAMSLLADGKIIGLSLAYNDDDEPEIDPALTQRDNFIGSVAVTEEHYNDHWMIADDFGTIRLIEGDFDGLNTPARNEALSVSVFPNPASGNFNLKMENDYLGEVIVRVIDASGREISTRTESKTSRMHAERHTAPDQAGLYVVQVICGQQVFTEILRVTK